MSVERARIIKATHAGGDARGVANVDPNATSARDATFAPRAPLPSARASARDATFAPNAPNAALARRVPAKVVDAHEEAARIVAEARAHAEAILAEAKGSVAAVVEAAARDAREEAIARVTAEHLAERLSEEERVERHLDRTIDLAVLLAERLVGEALAVDPARITALARGALVEARGARRLRIEACPDDLPALEAMLASLGASVATVEASADLARGSLVVHTELGRVDARLAPQLARLAPALREALREGSPRSPRE
jgi:flagellar assembly protein FliH/type III secretion protein L